ncbi:MAG: hypothetical protein GWP05_04260, partial [Anaerolineaceae bacterium]|nr:hypothetical protein [Anaerolineaceae bacterium]
GGLGGCGDGDEGGKEEEWEPPLRPISVADSREATPSTSEPRVYDPKKTYQAIVKTTMGEFRLAFYPSETPETVKTFVTLAMRGFYTDLVVHRVIADLMIQTGDPEGTGSGNPGFTVKGEFTNRPFVPGTVGLARAANPNSGNSQWFVCLRRNPVWDSRYAAFGRVIEGLEVARKISRVEVEGDRAIDVSRRDRPVDPPRILSIEVVEIPSDD